MIMSTPLRPTLFAAAACMLALPAPAQAPATLNVSVHVSGKPTGQPIHRAAIDVFSATDEMLRQRVLTNQQGVALIDELPLATLRFQVRGGNGWSIQNRSVDLNKLKAAPTLRFELEPPAAAASAAAATG
jgi:hypothetical protein